MSTEAHVGRLPATEWDGGAFPFRVGHRKLGMWLFIVSDAMTFSAMLIAYSYARVSSDAWPTPFPFFPSIIFSTTMTLFLLASSFTMVMAVRASAYNRLRAARRWILATKDAHELYKKFEFAALRHPERWMEKTAPNAY